MNAFISFNSIVQDIGSNDYQRVSVSTSETIIYECAPLNPRPLADNFLRTGNPKSSFIKGSEDSWSVISVISTEMMR